MIPDECSLRNWTAFQFFQKGAAMLYAGQEKGCTHCPGLFDKDTLAWDGHGADGMDLDLAPLIRRLSAMKKDPVFVDSTYHLNVLQNDTVIGIHTENTWRPDSSEAFKGVAMEKGLHSIFILEDGKDLCLRFFSSKRRIASGRKYTACRTIRLMETAGFSVSRFYPMLSI